MTGVGRSDRPGPGNVTRRRLIRVTTECQMIFECLIRKPEGASNLQFWVGGAEGI